MINKLLVNFYRIWHGYFHMRGAGKLLEKMAQYRYGLQHYMLQLPEGHRIEVDFRDVTAFYWLNHMLNDEFEEKGLLLAMQNFMKGDDVVWDIGANSGLLAYQLAKAGTTGELHSFEPNPIMSRLASQAVSGFKHATVHPYGLSDREAEFTLTVPSGHTTMGTLEPDSTHRSGNPCKVSCRKGDDLVFKDGFKPPQIIKIDTEGHELSVLKGLERTISTYHPVIFFEHISLDSGSIKELIAECYSQHIVCDSTGELHPADAVHLGHNSILVPTK